MFFFFVFIKWEYIFAKCITLFSKLHRSKRHVEAATLLSSYLRLDTDLGLYLPCEKFLSTCTELVLFWLPPAFHQCLDSIKSPRRLSLFRVSYPTTMTTEVGREEIMRADSPLVIPQKPSSTSSCLNASIADDRPSTLKRQSDKSFL